MFHDEYPRKKFHTNSVELRYEFKNQRNETNHNESQ